MNALKCGRKFETEYFNMKTDSIPEVASNRTYEHYISDKSRIVHILYIKMKPSLSIH